MFKDKLGPIAAKTKITDLELGRVCRWEILGALAIAIGGFLGCAGDAKNKPAAEPAPDMPVQAGAQKPVASEAANAPVEVSTRAAQPDKSKSCGPYPGYPCGTKYYTLSRADFRR